MGSLFRSEPMVLCQLFLQNESAYSSVSNLGELGLVQFRDTNASVSAFQRRFISQVTRCDEMERKLTFVENEIIKDEIRMDEVDENPVAPQPKEMIDLESTFEKLENELKEVNSNSEALKKTYFELTELKNVLTQAHTFFADQEIHQQVETLDHTNLVQNEVPTGSSSQHGFVTGVIAREKILNFEMMLWRVCRGKVFLKQAELESAVEDPITGAKLNKVVFMLFFQGDQLKGRVKKICDGFHATLYPCPESFEEREKMLTGVKTRLEDINQVLNQTQDHRHRLLANAAKSIKMWLIKVRKVKAIYVTMNLFNQDVTKECLIAECWTSLKYLPAVQQALRDATEESGSSVPSIVNRMETKEAPPTYNILNKFTRGFQNIVDAYGVASYMEVNPAPFTIITFPFIFAVMFGDFGHGLIMALFAIWMIWKEKYFLSHKSDNEMWNTMFGGRYIVCLMGLFSIYTGLIYNDIFSKSINIFGTSWNIFTDDVFVDPKTVKIWPKGGFNNSSPYPFGMDPIWQTAKNKILFLNSYKMKLSIITGFCQMLFGLLLSIFNHLHFKHYLNVFCEFIPQLIFLVAIFGYLVLMIFLKWIWYDATIACPPTLLIAFINMFMMKYPAEPCDQAPFYSGQPEVQKTLVFIALICVPWMLIVKPVIKHNRKRGYQVTPSDHEEEESFMDLFIHQAIHTIEYCLGSISHTASYLRLWALSLAHAQLSDVLWDMVMKKGFGMGLGIGVIPLYIVFAFWAFLTIGILLLMEGLSAFLHALRLHWVEFQSKFYEGQGYAFVPFSFKAIVEGEV